MQLGQGITKKTLGQNKVLCFGQPGFKVFVLNREKIFTKIEKKVLRLKRFFFCQILVPYTPNFKIKTRPYLIAHTVTRNSDFFCPLQAFEFSYK